MYNADGDVINIHFCETESRAYCSDVTNTHFSDSEKSSLL